MFEKMTTLMPWSFGSD